MLIWHGSIKYRLRALILLRAAATTYSACVCHQRPLPPPRSGSPMSHTSICGWYSYPDQCYPPRYHLPQAGPWWLRFSHWPSHWVPQILLYFHVHIDGGRLLYGHYPCCLSLPLSPTKLTSSAFAPLITRFDLCLLGWRALLLSSGGCLVLCNVVLNNLPTYFMCS